MTQIEKNHTKIGEVIMNNDKVIKELLPDFIDIKLYKKIVSLNDNIFINPTHVYGSEIAKAIGSSHLAEYVLNITVVVNPIDKDIELKYRSHGKDYYYLQEKDLESLSESLQVDLSILIWKFATIPYKKTGNYSYDCKVEELEKEIINIAEFIVYGYMIK